MPSKSQAGRWVFIMFYMFFLAFFLFVLAVSPFPNAVIVGANMTISAPACNIGGWFAVIDAIVCAISYIAYFFGFITISVSQGYSWLWLLVFGPLTAILAWAVIEVIRGNN